MNRIVVIGNGFDKAHGLATGYKDFIDDYWTKFGNGIYQKYSDRETAFTHSDKIGTSRGIYHEDEFVRFEIFKGGAYMTSFEYIAKEHKGVYGELLNRLLDFYKSGNRYYNSLNINFKNNFLKHISNRCYLTNWVDIENEYYGKLKELLTENDADMRHHNILKLNQDFGAIKQLLEKYLMRVVKEVHPLTISSVQKAFNQPINPEEISHSKRFAFYYFIQKIHGIIDDDWNINQTLENDGDYELLSKDECIQRYIEKQLKSDNKFKQRYCHPSETLLLNFNYTNTAERLYTNEKDEVIHIHGELNNPHNPMIFGYGDELDDDYKQIEKLQDNDFLENIKSIRYHETGNYRNLLSFLEADLYQVVVMGHSCGNSDRTLLNTLLEHPNCASVKVYYHQIDENTDNYSQIVRNLSRNFNDKAAMRDKVVNKELCTPLVPIQKE